MKTGKIIAISIAAALAVAVVASVGCYMLYSMYYGTKGEVEYFPFRESENGLWGMMSPSGKILCEEEFKESPTVARDGRFMVRNLDGLWEIYTAEATPKKVGSEYAFASMFQNGKALVAEKNCPITIIDTNGKVLKQLDKINGKPVDMVERFSEGYAVFKVENLYGAIDMSGDVVVKPEYCYLASCSDGKFVAVHQKYAKELKNDSTNLLKFDVLDTSGKAILSLSKNKYKEIGQFFHDDLLDVYVESKEEKCGGIINSKGDVIVKPTAKIKKVGQIRGRCFTYNNGDGWGLMTTAGESLIRAKYDELYFANDDMLVAVTKKDNGSISYKLVDKEDRQIGDETYDLASSFDILDGEHALVKVSEKMFSLVNRKGVQVEKLPDMVDVRLIEGDYVVESDYVEMKTFLDKVNFDQNGVDGLTFSTTPAEFIKFYVKQDDCYYGTKEHPATDLFWYTSSSDYLFTKKVNNINTYVNVSYSGNLTKRTYVTKRVIDYTWGNYYWYHNETKPTGYAYNGVTVKSFNITFPNNGKLRGKLLNLYLALSERFKNMGKVERENNRAVIVTLKNNLRAVVAMDEEYVYAMWGNIKAVKDIDISKYKDIKEKPVRVKDFDYFDNYLPIASDDTAADSTAVAE